MTAAKVMDVKIAQDKQHTQYQLTPQVKMEDAPMLLEIPQSECPDVWIRLPRHTWRKSRSSIEDPVVLLKRNLYGHPLAGLLRERQFMRKFFLQPGWEKALIRECLFVHRKHGLFLSVDVYDIKMAAKKQNLSPMWKKIDEVGSFFDNQHHFLTTCNLGCTQREWNRGELFLSSTERCSSHECLLEQLKSYQSWDKPHAKAVAWSYDVEGHAKKCGERFWELANRKSSCTKSQLLSTTITSRRKTWKRLERCPKSARRLSWNARIFARVGRPDILLVCERTCWSSHNMDRSLWQTVTSFDSLHSSHESPTIL